MLGRRSFLAALTAAPAVAKQSLANSGSVNTPSVSDYSGDPWADSPCEPDPLIEKLQRSIQRLRDKEEDKLFIAPAHPPAIGERKSWSTAFKNHCFTQDRDAHRDKWDDAKFYHMDKGDLIALAKRLGVYND